jgi:hypothetical protein
MRKLALLGAAAAVVLGLAGVVAVSTSNQAAEAAARPRTLTFDVVFSPFELIKTDNERDPAAPVALGDEIVFHDQLSAKGRPVGDEVGSCVVAAVDPGIVANCSGVIRLPDGTVAFQFANVPGPDPKDLALTGGTGRYRTAGGDGTLVEFGNGKGRLTLRLVHLAGR